MTLPDAVDQALKPHGMRVLGAFDVETGEETVALSGQSVMAVMLIGHDGGAIWQPFSRWLAGQQPMPDHPLDRWSKAIIEDVATLFAARAVYPSDKPYLPFQRWAMRAPGLKPSPLGLLIHPEYGLWHAFRGALLFDRALGLKAETPRRHPCDDCRDKPCLTACPVSAVSADVFHVETCRSYLKSGQGMDCMETGCRARNACPVGAQYRYPADQQAFHQRAFTGA